ncbi:MAG: chalcone isomerase family protein [Planctomycetia bacterium]
MKPLPTAVYALIVAGGLTSGELLRRRMTLPAEPTPAPIVVQETVRRSPAPAVDPIGENLPPLPGDDVAPSAPMVVALQPAAEQIDGFPATMVVKAASADLPVQLTGKLTRKKTMLFITLDIYDVASYVAQPKSAPADVLLDDMLVDGTPRVYMLRFLKPATGSQIMTAINEEITLTFTDVDMVKVGASVEEFVQTFKSGASSGDEVFLVWLPGGNIYCAFNTKEKVTRIGDDATLARAIWRIWAGEGSGPERFDLVKLFAQPTAAATADAPPPAPTAPVGRTAAVEGGQSPK